MSGVKTHFNMTPNEYEEMRAGHFEAHRLSLVTDALRPRGEPGTAVLEIGVGTGRNLANLAAGFPDLRFEGIDVEPEMIAYARDRYRLPNLRYDVADVTRDRLPSRYTFVFSVDVLHHLHDPLHAFQSLHVATMPGATWLAIEPNVFHPYAFVHQERLRRAGFDEDHFRPWRIEPLLTMSGFEIVHREFRSLIPGWWKKPPEYMRQAERLLERFPLLGGSIVYHLVAR